MKALALAVTLLSALALAQDRDLAKVQLKSTPVAGRVHLLQGEGGNIGVSVGPDGLLIVDDEFAPLAPKIRAALHRLGKGPLEYVLNTHFHGDHTGSNAVFGREAKIIAHDAVRTRLLSGRKTPGAETPPAPPAALPVITYEQGVKLWFNGEEIRITHLPAGHTDGDSTVLFVKSNVLHMGDLFFVDHFPFIDVTAGGSVEGYVKNVETVLASLPADVKIIPGHGPLSGRADLERFAAMLRETSALVRQKKAAGMSLEQVKREGLPEKYKGFSWEFISTEGWLETLYEGVSVKKT
ncbi:MBL fold metallo-hydrolase [Aggregicoccus sp. 17bor-14]|uniref:MBL fold metallo-hydrolase n=1 Tax=Myxococcaceae TaxID=31 RepID=UPI00129C860B|nr:MULTISPECIES: MBL fold metallo-hydrolase [Myxococcaceae]MBF5046091.1 MBL fold metallo-hydrolase [Simulacricoccus sp. 17bor-14]MRI91820.1 MBL fold metallo-hydrolase [Aggregicoccus sp. 17bor-14]